MCSVGSARGPASDGVPAAVSERRAPTSDRSSARPTTSYGDGVVMAADEGDVLESVTLAGVTMSAVVMSEDVNVTSDAPSSVPCATEPHTWNGDGTSLKTPATLAPTAAPAPASEVPDCESDVSDDDANPCNQTFYGEADGEDADADTDENTYELGLHEPEQDEDYDDWFAVSNDEEIRTIATADLRPFYGSSGEGGGRPVAMFHLAEDLDSEPELPDGYSCLETIVEENSDDMRSDCDSLRSGHWSSGSERNVNVHEPEDGATSPTALTAGPPGWTWCLEPSDSTGAADDWGSEDECEPTPRLRRASAGDELMSADSLGQGSLLSSWDQPLTKSCVGAPLFSDLPPPRPLAATTTAAWRQSPELMLQAAPLSHGEFQGHHWRVDNEPISAELNHCGAGERRHSDPGTCGCPLEAPAADPELTGGADELPAAAARPVSPQGRRGSAAPPAPTPRTGCGGSGAPVTGHDPADMRLGAARHAQLVASTAERCTISAGRTAVTSTPAARAAAGDSAGVSGATVPEACGRVTAPADDPKWDLGSCEDFENLDRRIESLTFDFEEEERTLQTLESLESACSQPRRRYQRLGSSRQASVEEPEQRGESLRRFHSSGDLTMVSEDARADAERTAPRRRPDDTTRLDGDSGGGAVQTSGGASETTVTRPHARVDLLRHSSENLSEDSGFGEQPAGARSSSEASSPPPSLSLPTAREETSARPEPSPGRLERRSHSTPDLSPSAQRRRRLLELIGRDERRRARVFADVVASDARDAADDVRTSQPSAPPNQPGGETASKERPVPVPAPRAALPKPTAVYQNIPANAWLASLAAGGDGEKVAVTAQLRSPQVNGSPDALGEPAPRPPAESGTCDEQRCGAVAARPTPTTRGFARAMPDLPLDCDDGVRDDQVVVRAETRGPIGAVCNSEPAAVDDKWQAVNTREQSPSRPRTHDPSRPGDPRDTYRTEAEPQPLQLHRRASGRPKPLDIAMAEEFLLLEGADGERFATDAVVFSPDGAADGARHIRAAGVGAGGAADSVAAGTAQAGAAGSVAPAAAGTAERPIAQPAAAGAAAPGNRRPLSQCDLTAADGPAAEAPEPTDSADGGSASDLDSCGEPMAAPRQEARTWGRPAPAAPLPRLHGHGHGHGLDYPDWLDVSMEPPDTGEVSSVGGFFSRVAASAAPPETAGLPGLVSGADGGAVRRYGTPQSAVEVRINRQDQKNPPAVSGRVKGVQFSPMVSEVRWRETYLDEDSTDGRSMSPAWDARDEEYCRGEPGAPPRPPLPAQHAALRPAGHTSSSAGQSAPPPPPPPRTDSRSVSARSAETQRLRVSFPVDGGDGHTVRRQVVTCERAPDVTQTHAPPPRADAAEMPTRRSASLTATPPAVPRAAAAQQPEKSRTMMERLGLGRLSGSRRRAAGGQERSSLTSRRSPSPGVSSVVVRETEITSPRPEVVTPVAATSLDTARPVAAPAPRAAPRTVSPAEAAAVSAAATVGRTWDTSNRASPRVDTSPSPQPSPQRLDYLDQPICVTSAPERETVISPEPAITTPKPPLPPRVTASQVTRARLISARNQFLSSPSAAPRAVPPPPVPDASPPPGDGAATEVRDAFERFRRQAREERERLAQSTPDLSLIETTTKRLVRPPSPDPRPRHAEPHRDWRDDGYEIDWGESTSTVRPARPAPSPVARAWPKMPPRRPAGERLPSQETDLDSIVRGLQQFIDEISPGRGKAKSLLNLEQTEELTCRTAAAAADSRAKSMEFLLDEENKATTLPPENQLMRGGAARELSRPELRFQRSLRNLNTPEWYRRAAVAPVAALRRNHHDTASLQGGWSGLSSKSNSKESLPTCAAPTPLPRRGDWRSFRASRETSSVPGTASASPAPLSRRASSGSSRRPGCPAAAAPAAVSGSPGARRPYLGWRSQERLTRSGYQTPEERLASSFRGTPGVRRQVAPQERPPVSSEGQVTPPPAAQHVSASIREVTDAIVHYFDPDVQTQNGRRESPGLTRAAREESPSKQRSLWLETAFVGTRPADGAGEPTKGGSTIGGALLPSADVRKEPFELGEFVAV